MELVLFSGVLPWPVKSVLNSTNLSRLALDMTGTMDQYTKGSTYKACI